MRHLPSLITVILAATILAPIQFAFADVRGCCQLGISPGVCLNIGGVVPTCIPTVPFTYLCLDGRTSKGCENAKNEYGAIDCKKELQDCKIVATSFSQLKQCTVINGRPTCPEQTSGESKF